MPVEQALSHWSATALVAAYRTGELSPVEVHDAVQDVIAAREPELNAFWVHDAESSRTAARESEQRWRRGAPAGPIDGVPVTLKENVARAGIPMPAGNAGVDAVVPAGDSPIAARVAAAGGVVLGSTVMPDWGMLSSGVSSRHGITRSPWNPAWTTGGSSAGAGAAAAAGYGPLHVGTDIGGSIRLPATWLGLVGLKPSAGRIPLDAPFLGRCAGPLTRTADDAGLLMRVLAGPDDRDWTCLPAADLDWTLPATDDVAVRGLRVGLQVSAGCGEPAEGVVLDAVRAAAATFEAAGAVVEPLDPFVAQEWLDGLDLFWRVRSLRDLQALSDEQQQRVHPYIVTWCEAAADTSGTRVLECYQQIMHMQQATVAATEAYDIVLSPVAPCPAFPAEWPMPYADDGRGMRHVGFTAPYNMSGQPAASVNAGFTPDGRPIGVQIAGRRYDDVGVLRAVHWYEAHRAPAANPVWPSDARSASVAPSDDRSASVAPSHGRSASVAPSHGRSASVAPSHGRSASVAP